MDRLTSPRLLAALACSAALAAASQLGWITAGCVMGCALLTLHLHSRKRLRYLPAVVALVSTLLLAQSESSLGLRLLLPLSLLPFGLLLGIVTAGAELLLLAALPDPLARPPLALLALLFLMILLALRHLERTLFGANRLGLFQGVRLLPPVLLLGSFLFIFLPRPELERLRSIRKLVSPIPKESLKRIGFGGDTSLMWSGLLAQDPAVVMDVRLTQADGNSMIHESAIYLRGQVYDRYLGRSWVIPDERTANAGAGWRDIVPAAARPEGTLVRQSIRLDPLNTATLFAIPEVVAIKDLAIEVDRCGSFFLPAPAERSLQYEVVSLQRRVEPLRMRMVMRVTAPGEGSERPILTPRVEALAERWVNEERPLIYVCRYIEAALQERCRYSLNIPQAEDPLDTFLFEKKRGCCLHFASAMVAILRAQGISARLVGGFSSHEQAAEPNHFVLRAMNAHAWVEVWFGPENGWVQFDPTPPIFREYMETAAEDAASLEAAGNAVAFGAMLAWMQEMLEAQGEEQERRVPFWPLTIALAALVTLALLFRRRRLLAPARALAKRRAQSACDRYLARLAQLGFARGPGETLREVTTRAAPHLPGVPLDETLELLSRARYAEIPLRPEEMKILQQRIGQIVKAR